MYLGYFWGIIFITLLIGAVAKGIVTWFYDKFIRSKSKNVWRRIIETTVGLKTVLEECHGVFAVGSLVAAMFHFFIMKYIGKITVTGVVTILTFFSVFVLGFIYKYVYHDKSIATYHKVMVKILIVFLIIHFIFGK